MVKKEQGCLKVPWRFISWHQNIEEAVPPSSWLPPKGFLEVFAKKALAKCLWLIWVPLLGPALLLAGKVAASTNDLATGNEIVEGRGCWAHASVQSRWWSYNVQVINCSNKGPGSHLSLQAGILVASTRNGVNDEPSQWREELLNWLHGPRSVSVESCDAVLGPCSRNNLQILGAVGDISCTHPTNKDSSLTFAGMQSSCRLWKGSWSRGKRPLGLWSKAYFVDEFCFHPFTQTMAVEHPDIFPWKVFGRLNATFGRWQWRISLSWRKTVY